MKRVLTGIGSDQPGVMDEVTQQLAAARMTLIQVKVANVAGSFAMAVLVDVPGEPSKEALNAVAEACGRLAGGTFRFYPASDVSSLGLHRLSINTPTLDVTLQKVSNLLRVIGVNIDEVDTAADGHLKLSLALPTDLPPQKLRELIGQLLPETVIWSLDLA